VQKLQQIVRKSPGCLVFLQPVNIFGGTRQGGLGGCQFYQDEWYKAKSIGGKKSYLCNFLPPTNGVGNGDTFKVPVMYYP
jgi:hypothetical protein